MDKIALRTVIEEMYSREYEKATEYLEQKNPLLNPKKKREIARKIAKNKCKKYLEKFNLQYSDLVERDEVKLEDLV